MSRIVPPVGVSASRPCLRRAEPGEPGWPGDQPRHLEV